MTEDYLQHAWLFSNYNSLHLTTTENESIQILEKGILNRDSGPDFLNAKIKINNTVWVGHVEIHINSSMWNLHKHQFDPAYNNVVLHVVLNDDKQIRNMNGDTIPTLELRNRIYSEHFNRYFNLISLAHVYPCENQLKHVNEFKLSNWFHQLAYQRMMDKVDVIQNKLVELNGDWDKVLFFYLASSFGMKVNKKVMEQLVESTPLSIIKKESFSLFSLEALLFGQADLLSSKQDDYQQELFAEYFYLKQKYKLQKMSRVEWKFSRMRPTNFPTLRIAQLASIYNEYQNLFGIVRDKESRDVIEEVFSSEVSEYWKNHYRFGVESKNKTGRIGKLMIDTLFINVIIPISIAYGKSINDETYVEHGIEMLESVNFEKNKKSKFWIDVNGVPKNAVGSQAAIKLLDDYCLSKKCLSCVVGIDILRK